MKGNAPQGCDGSLHPNPKCQVEGCPGFVHGGAQCEVCDARQCLRCHRQLKRGGSCVDCDVRTCQNCYCPLDCDEDRCDTCDEFRCPKSDCGGTIGGEDKCSECKVYGCHKCGNNNEGECSCTVPPKPVDHSKCWRCWGRLGHRGECDACAWQDTIAENNACLARYVEKQKQIEAEIEATKDDEPVFRVETQTGLPDDVKTTDIPSWHVVMGCFKDFERTVNCLLTNHLECRELSQAAVASLTPKKSDYFGLKSIKITHIKSGAFRKFRVARVGVVSRSCGCPDVHSTVPAVSVECGGGEFPPR